MTYPVSITHGYSLSGGLSQDAALVGSLITNVQISISNTVSYGNPSNQLTNLFSECSSEGWDGYGATAIHTDTFRNASRFLQSLPFYLLSPDISPEPDGHVAFEWYYEPRRVVTISISPEGYLHFAALIGSKKRCGSELFLGEISEDILNIIRQVIEK